MIVLDASAVVDLLLEREPAWGWVAGRVAAAESLHAPALLDLEVLSVLRRRTRGGVLSAERAAFAVEDLASMRLIRWPATELLERIWELRENLTPYDASYVALAETLDAPLVTTDARLARVPGHRAVVRSFRG